MTGIAIFAFGVFLAFVVGIGRGGWWLVPMLASSFVSFYLVWSRYPWHSKLSPYMSFGGALLLACFLNRIFYLADFFVSGERFSEWPFFAEYPELAVLKAEVTTVLGVFITFLAWVYGGGLKVSRRMELKSVSALASRLLLLIYVVSLIALVLTAAFELPAGLSQLFGALLGLGSACSFFLPMQVLRSRFAQLALSVLMCAPFFYQSLGTGMKENIILSILPAGYYFWMSMRSWVLRLVSVLSVLAFLGLLTSYIGFFRVEVWQKERSFSQGDALKEYSQRVSREGLDSVLGSGIEKFLGRANASAYRGWAISRADEYRFEPELVFAPMVYVFIPRMIWADKPLIKQGWEYSGLVFGSRYTQWSSSSTAAGYYPSLYLGGGWPAVLVGAVIVGLMMAMLMRLAWQLGGQQLLSLYSFSMIPYALRLDETWTVGAISGPIIGFIYVWTLYILFTFVSPQARRVSFSRRETSRTLGGQRRL